MNCINILWKIVISSIQNNWGVTVLDFDQFWPILHMKYEIKPHIITHYVWESDNGVLTHHSISKLYQNIFKKGW